MVIVTNKSNRPIGVAGVSILPDKEAKIKDKDVFCAVYNEDGEDTGEKMIIPGLAILEKKGIVAIKVEEEKKPAAKKAVKVEVQTDAAEPETAEPVKKVTRTRTKKTAE